MSLVGGLDIYAKNDLARGTLLVLDPDEDDGDLDIIVLMVTESGRAVCLARMFYDPDEEDYLQDPDPYKGGNRVQLSHLTINHPTASYSYRITYQPSHDL